MDIFYFAIIKAPIFPQSLGIKRHQFSVANIIEQEAVLKNKIKVPFVSEDINIACKFKLKPVVQQKIIKKSGTVKITCKIVSL